MDRELIYKDSKYVVDLTLDTYTIWSRYNDGTILVRLHNAESVEGNRYMRQRGLLSMKSAIHKSKRVECI